MRLRLWVRVVIFLRDAESFGVKNVLWLFFEIHRARRVSSWALGLGMGAYVERCRRRDETSSVGVSFNDVRIKPHAALGSRSERRQIDASRRWRPLPVKSAPSGATPICGGDCVSIPPVGPEPRRTRNPPSKLADVDAEVKSVGDIDEWYVRAYTDKLAAGHEKLRNALAEIVKTARDNGWVEAGKAEGWLEKLEKGLTLKEGWPKYYVGLKDGALEVIYKTTDPEGIVREVQRLREMGLEEGRHFSVKMPEGGRNGYVSILRKGLERAAWLSEHGSGRQRELAAEFVSYILQRAKEEGEDVYRKVAEVVEEGKARGSLRLEGLEKRVEVGGKEHVVKVIDGGAVEEDRGGRKLLRIRITAEVDGVRREYEITFGRYGKRNATEDYATARADAPGGREADAERLAAVIEALTGVKPWIHRKSDGRIEIICGRKHLDGFMRYKELANTIKKWLEKTSRR